LHGANIKDASLTGVNLDGAMLWKKISKIYKFNINLRLVVL
jgi:uncharacterized protein YjbI with pentapeptide repeats